MGEMIKVYVLREEVFAAGLDFGSYHGGCMYDLETALEQTDIDNDYVFTIPPNPRPRDVILQAVLNSNPEYIAVEVECKGMLSVV